MTAPFSKTKYVQAFRRLGGHVSEDQRRMLAAHAAAPDRVLDDTQLARAAGKGHPNYAHTSYGRLGHSIVRALRSPLKARYWTRIIASESRSPAGEIQWTLYPEVAGAVEVLGWKPDVVVPKPPDKGKGPRPTPAETMRKALIDARLGQGRFRQELMFEWGSSCAVTGCDVLDALKASHIKPWRDCTNEERLDPGNGVLLVATLDALFDAGLITFEASGRLRCSPQLPRSSHQALGIRPGMRLRLVNAKRQSYLEWHRKQVFVS